MACVLRAEGPDARTFLQGQFSNDLGKLASGEVAYGLWLDRKGKVEADSFALCEGDEGFLLASYYCEESAVRERLEAYLIMDEVELSGETGKWIGVSAWGDAIEVAREALGVELPEEGAWSEAAGVVMFWGRRGEERVLEILIPADEEREKELRSVLEESGACGLDDADLLRFAIEGNVARIGKEFSGGLDLPQELDLEVVGISYRKGCYLGQEVMARIHAMGKVRKRLARVEVLGTEGEFELPMDIFNAEGKKRGSLRCSLYSDDGCVGQAVLAIGCEGEELNVGGARLKILEGSDD